MKIISAYEVPAVVIETDDKEFPTYKRYSSDSWECLMGMSWEPVFFREEELETMYQNWLKSNQGLS